MPVGELECRCRCDADRVRVPANSCSNAATGSADEGGVQHRCRHTGTPRRSRRLGLEVEERNGHDGSYSRLSSLCAGTPAHASWSGTRSTTPMPCSPAPIERPGSTEEFMPGTPPPPRHRRARRRSQNRRPRSRGDPPARDVRADDGVGGDGHPGSARDRAPGAHRRVDGGRGVTRRCQPSARRPGARPGDAPRHRRRGAASVVDAATGTPPTVRGSSRAVSTPGPSSRSTGITSREPLALTSSTAVTTPPAGAVRPPRSAHHATRSRRPSPAHGRGSKPASAGLP